jgi:hypothetical protein
VSNGAFSSSVELEPALQARDKLWLQVEVRDASGAFVALAEREAVQPKALAAGVCWDTTGNSGNVAGTSFLGNIDNVPLELRANNKRNALPGAKDGRVLWRHCKRHRRFAGNYIPSSTIGATIAGGAQRSPALPVPPAGIPRPGNFSVVSGGTANNASGEGSAIDGGDRNSTPGFEASIGGGFQNTAAGALSAIGGGGWQ